MFGLRAAFPNGGIQLMSNKIPINVYPRSTEKGDREGRIVTNVIIVANCIVLSKIK